MREEESRAEGDRLKRVVPDVELREFARSDAAGARSVLIEIEAPEPRLEVSRRRGEGAARRRQAVTPSPQERELVEKRLGELASLVETLTGSAPKVLEAAHALVAELTPEQLREVSRHEHTRAVRPNRRRGVRRVRR